MLPFDVPAAMPNVKNEEVVNLPNEEANDAAALVAMEPDA